MPRAFSAPLIPDLSNVESEIGPGRDPKLAAAGVNPVGVFYGTGETIVRHLGQVLGVR